MLVLALAMTFASTGCKKKPINTTPLPGSKVGTPRDPNPTGIEGAGTYRPESPIPVINGNVPVNPNGWDPNDPSIKQDREKFAALTVHFAFDSAAIRTSERVKVDSMAAALQSDQSVLLLIEGHCDERGTEEYNRSLGEKRALSLREELVKAGINPDRIHTRSFGEDKPAVQGHDESAWSKNRRGEFIACTRQ